MKRVVALICVSWCHYSEWRGYENQAGDFWQAHIHFFDGTTHVTEAFVLVIRFVDDWTVKQWVARMILLAKSSVSMRTVSVLYNQFFDVGCISHMLDLVGEHMNTTVLDALVNCWIGISHVAQKHDLHGPLNPQHIPWQGGWANLKSSARYMTPLGMYSPSVNLVIYRVLPVKTYWSFEWSTKIQEAQDWASHYRWLHGALCSRYI